MGSGILKAFGTPLALFLKQIQQLLFGQNDANRISVSISVPELLEEGGGGRLSLSWQCQYFPFSSYSDSSLCLFWLSVAEVFVVSFVQTPCSSSVT